jgi:hypothetical protein
MEPWDMMSFIFDLPESESKEVLKGLILSRRDVLKDAYDLSLKALGKVEPDSIARLIKSDIEFLDYFEIKERAGRTSFTAISSAAYEVFDERIGPYFREMRKWIERGKPKEAKTYCIGIIRGLMRAKGCNNLMKNFIFEAPDDYIAEAIDEWKSSDPSEEDIAEVMKEVERE